VSEAPPRVDDVPPADERPPAPRTRAEARREAKRAKHAKRGGVLGFLKELPGLIIIAFLLALLIKSFLVQAFFIPSESMVPTLKVGDRVLVNKLADEFGTIDRGDVIVFQNPNLDEPRRNPFEAFWNWLTEGLGFASNPEKDFIKRVIAVEDDTIEIRDGTVLVNGAEVEEPYVNPRAPDHTDMAPTVIEPGRIFVMGDNRPNSQDSRGFLGQVSEDLVVGEAFVLLWPPSRLGWL
jgi:signal peptidase I